VTPGRVLGELDFPTSATSQEAEAAFIRGMLLLHLFEYPFARDEFISAQQLEPGFAMAYWGEAMTYNHPIWISRTRSRAQPGKTRNQRVNRWRPQTPCAKSIPASARFSMVGQQDAT
jgi:hypothetical protein